MSSRSRSAQHQVQSMDSRAEGWEISVLCMPPAGGLAPCLWGLGVADRCCSWAQGVLGSWGCQQGLSAWPGRGAPTLSDPGACLAAFTMFIKKLVVGIQDPAQGAPMWTRRPHFCPGPSRQALHPLGLDSRGLASRARRACSWARPRRQTTSWTPCGRR